MADAKIEQRTTLVACGVVRNQRKWLNIQETTLQ